MQSATYHHGNLRQALLDEAATVLETAGPDALSLRGLAKALGVSHAAPGHHFSSRALLIAELAADGYAGLADAMDSAMDAADADRWLAEAGRAYVRFALAHPQRYRLMFSSGILGSDCPPRLLTESTRAYLSLLTAVHQGPPPGSQETYAMDQAEFGAWSIVHGAVMLWLDGQLGAVESEERFLELADSVLAANF